MTEPRPVPPPPQYPPSVGRVTYWSNTPPEPTVIVMAAEQPQEQPKRRLLPDWRWRPTAAVFALSPGLWWAHTLTDPALTTRGGYAISGIAVLIAGGLDVARGWWITRVGLYAALIGPALALPGRPLLDLINYLITGVTP
ncbi:MULTISPECIES: hypothetical protein [Streptomyces]|uniref:hypothetical protein n=1 Tax=Streptomyces lycopersici TaxID=2974589 RepID=UPI0021CF3FD2|nr:hypothetical protein [Streptomyces sp. NEAU-383]